MKHFDKNRHIIVSPKTLKLRLKHMYINLYTHVIYVLLAFRFCFYVICFESTDTSKVAHV